jgi:hypothetical protein
MSISKKDIGAILIFVVLIIAFIFLVNTITTRGDGRELEIVRDAVKNAALTCYAVEGMYPDDLQYLRDHYNLSYNEDKYVVYYEPFASNVIPSIKVVERGATDL